MGSFVKNEYFILIYLSRLIMSYPKCEHGRQKCRCKECGGSSICIHGKQVRYCKECGGSAFCEHQKLKLRCKECGGSHLCKNEGCDVRGMKKYDGYCLRCCVYLRPDIQVSRNYKTKETEVVTRVREFFPEFDWVSDKRVEGGCSTRRPDLLLHLGTHVIIVEVDEHKHSSYDCSCENKRLMQISQDLDHVPIVFIRFNPDAYTRMDGSNVASCWRTNKLGILQLCHLDEWEVRILSLKDMIQTWIDHPSDKTIEIIEMFY